MKRRLLKWGTTWLKLVLLVLGYFWVGAAYKLVYAQTHDITPYKSRIQVPYYQQQFLIDTLLGQTWMFGRDFQQFIGRLPSLGAFFGSNPLLVLGDYFREREGQLADLAARHPQSLYAEEALEDASGFYSQFGSVFSVFGSRVPPGRALAFRTPQGEWRMLGAPDYARTIELSRRLADEYPESPQAPAALLRVARTEEQQGNTEASRGAYRRLAVEYPRSEEAIAAADALYQAAIADGRVEDAREYKRRALNATERLARERFRGRALPARNTVAILGYRVDLSGLELQLARVAPAKDLLDVAVREAERVRGFRSLDEGTRDDLRSVQRRMERTRNELWVAGLFEELRVGAPGPPPQPKQRSVAGSALLDGKPLAGVLIELAEGNSGERAPQMQNFTRLFQPSRYRAVTDRTGRFRIGDVPSGRYRLQARFPLREEGRLVTLQEPVDGAPFPPDLTLGEKDVDLPPLRLASALTTRSYGELPPSGKALRLEWDPWPGAARYRVIVQPPEGPFLAFFRSRMPRGERGPLPVLWESNGVSGTSVEVPLLSLATDAPEVARVLRYQYTVTAVDASGKPLARSADPVSQFGFSQQAFVEYLAQKPPRKMQAPRRGPRFRRRRAQEERQ